MKFEIQRELCSAHRLEAVGLRTQQSVASKSRICEKTRVLYEHKASSRTTPTMPRTPPNSAGGAAPPRALHPVFDFVGNDTADGAATTDLFERPMHHLEWNESSVCAKSTIAGVASLACLGLVDAQYCAPRPDSGSKCLLVSQTPLLGAQKSLHLLRMPHQQHEREVPQLDILRAAPSRCYNFVALSALSGAHANAADGNKMRERLIKQGQAAILPNIKNWRLVLLGGPCLELFLLGIPQHVSKAQQGWHAGRPLMRVEDYDELLPPRSKLVERALFRSSYPDPTLLEQLRNESHGQAGNSSSIPSALRRPAIVMGTSARFSRAAAELWAAGFDPIHYPGIYANRSICRSARDTPSYGVALENLVTANHRAGVDLIQKGNLVPLTWFEDDATLMTSLTRVHLYLDAHQDFDFVPLGGCVMAKRPGWSCGHAVHISSAWTRAVVKRQLDNGTLSCQKMLAGIDVSAYANCRKSSWRCSDWRPLEYVPNERFTPQERTSRLYGYGYFTQDRGDARKGVARADGSKPLCYLGVGHRC